MLARRHHRQPLHPTLPLHVFPMRIILKVFGELFEQGDGGVRAVEGARDRRQDRVPVANEMANVSSVDHHSAVLISFFSRFF